MFLYVFVLFTLAAAQGSSLSRKPRIVGGTHQAIENAPWQVAIQNFGNPICGGTILSPTYILTTASCVDNLDRDVTILSGTASLFQDGNLSNITGIEINAGFNGTLNDLAVIRLAKKLEITDKQKPAVLSNVQPSCGETVKFTGFGSTSDGFPTTPRPYDLRAVDLPVWPQSICSYFANGYSVVDDIICGGIYKGPCFGDVGGPITENDKVIGVSIKTNCYNEKPALFIKVANHKNFIDLATDFEAVWA